MVRARAVFVLVAVLVVGLVPAVDAASIYTEGTSGSWSWSCVFGCLDSGAAVEVSDPLAPLWAPETAGGKQWISSVDAKTVPLDTIIEFARNIEFGWGAGSVLTGKFWADDTASVSLDGSVLTYLNPGSAPNLGGLDLACADGGLACEASEFGEFRSGSLTGTHTLRVQVHQLKAATSSGTLAEIDVSPVPEPTTILLLGSALATAGIVSRRRFRKSGTEKA